MTALDNHLTAEELAKALKKKTGFGCEFLIFAQMARAARRAALDQVRQGHPAPDRFGFEAWLRAQVQQPVRSRRAA